MAAFAFQVAEFDYNFNVFELAAATNNMPLSSLAFFYIKVSCLLLRKAAGWALHAMFLVRPAKMLLEEPSSAESPRGTIKYDGKPVATRMPQCCCLFAPEQTIMCLWKCG